LNDHAEASGSTASDDSGIYRALEPEPNWVTYEPELERLCRVAALIGGDGPAPLSYTALVIAFLWGGDDVSLWLQEYVSSHSTIAVDSIFRSKDINPSHRETFAARADSGVLPEVTPLYSRSIKNVMQQAAKIARDVNSTRASEVVLGPCHVMAAYVFRNPRDHKDQVRGWGFEEADWQAAFLQFAEETFPENQWSRLKDAPASRAESISSFTSDDPLTPAVDLLNVEDEAAAFARILAARSVKPPLAVGIFGEWGSGKTFFMRRIYENVDDLTTRTHPEGKPQFHTDIVQIRFNAWHYIETNLWASLVEYIFTELNRWLAARSEGGEAGADVVFDRLATAQQLKLDALEDVVSRRAERRGAEQRAERARRDYEEAVARSAAVGFGTYTRAFLATFLKRDGVQDDLNRLGVAIGAPELARDAGRLVDVLEQARSEAGRTRLMVKSGVARLGRVPWLLALVLALIAVPLATVALKGWVASLPGWSVIGSIHDTVVAMAAICAGLAGWGGALVRQTSAALQQVDAFDRNLREQIKNGIDSSTDPAPAAAAEDELRKRRQELEAAERALIDADARLVAARQDFENASARSRLNAFIRAKASQGDYAKHLGIIAAIRRDFGQLAVLMNAASETDDQRRERTRLLAEAQARVTRFLSWLAGAQEVRLTQGELRSLVSLLEPDAALDVLAKHDAVLRAHVERGGDDIQAVTGELQAVKNRPMPTFSRVILYIDDLDRCPTENVVKVLQAVHLLLSFPLFTVVVAVDSRWVSRALREQYPGLLAETHVFSGNGELRPPGATSHDYLEKIFQIPYWVREVDEQWAQEYVATLVDEDVRRIPGGDGPASQETEGRAPASGGPPAGTPPPTGSGRATGAPRARRRTPRPRNDAQEATSLELSRWEADALERFAPFIGGTPRRLIRFVNVYRLIRTSLPDELRGEFLGTTGEGSKYRGLVVQLALVTGAPDACQRYFALLPTLANGDGLQRVLDELIKDKLFEASVDRQVVRNILTSAQAAGYGAHLTVEQLRETAGLARRYSFIARRVG
jgi:hypothetical protein